MTRKGSNDGRRKESHAEDEIRVERIERAILLIRGHRVITDSVLADLYGVATKRLNEQVKRNISRFPADFMFRLTREESALLRSQNATLNDHGVGRSGRGRHRKYLPCVFTEHGAIMAANVLNSPRAVGISILVVRAFVRLRHILATHKDLAHKIAELEREFKNKTAEHAAHIQRIYEILESLMTSAEEPEKQPIGFLTEWEAGRQDGAQGERRVPRRRRRLSSGRSG